MARRKDHSREELTQLAIDCGRKLVRKQGPAALTARNVAQAMGYTPGTLYNIFQNLEGLIVAINTESLNTLATEMDQVHHSEQNAEQRIYQFTTTYLDFQSSEPMLWQLLFATPIDDENLNDDFHTAVHRVFDPITDTLLPISRSLKAARRDAKIIWSTLHGICLLQQSNKLNISEYDSPEDLIQRFLQNFLQA